MKGNPSSESVFQQMRQQRRQGLRFEPTPIPAPSIESPRTTASKLGVCASPVDFAGHTGVNLAEIIRLLDHSELTHVRLSVDEPIVHGRKGLADLERKERGPAVAAN